MNENITINAGFVGPVLILLAIVTILTLFVINRKKQSLSGGMLVANFILNLIPIVGIIAFSIFLSKSKPSEQMN